MTEMIKCKGCFNFVENDAFDSHAEKCGHLGIFRNGRYDALKEVIESKIMEVLKTMRKQARHSHDCKSFTTGKRCDCGYNATTKAFNQAADLLPEILKKELENLK